MTSCSLSGWEENLWRGPTLPSLWTPHLPRPGCSPALTLMGSPSSKAPPVAPQNPTPRPSLIAVNFDQCVLSPALKVLEQLCFKSNSFSPHDVFIEPVCAHSLSCTNTLPLPLFSFIELQLTSHTVRSLKCTT